MRRMATLTLGVVLSSAAMAAPARAEDPGMMRYNAVGYNKIVGDGILSVIVCSVTGVPNPGWVPVATTVWCEINGSPSVTITAPGPTAAVPNANATTAPVTLCIHGRTVFSPTVGPPQTVPVDVCFETPIEG